MSHIKIKTTYNEEGAYGSTVEKTLYCHHNLTSDYVLFYDEDGKHLFTVCDTLNNHMFDAMKRLFGYYDIEERDDIEYMTKEEKEKIGF